MLSPCRCYIFAACWPSMTSKKVFGGVYFYFEYCNLWASHDNLFYCSNRLPRPSMYRDRISDVVGSPTEDEESVRCSRRPIFRVGNMLSSQNAPVAPVIFVSLKGYLGSSSFLNEIFFFFLVTTCSTQISRPFSRRNLRMNRGSHNSDAMPRSLQHLIKAFDLQPSVAVGMPSGSK